MTVAAHSPADQMMPATHRAMWALGDYARMAEEVMAPLAPLLLTAMGVRPGSRVLDVAAGSGIFSLAAARTGATVVSTYLTPELLQRAQARAMARGASLDCRQVHAHALPFADGEFDVVMSAMGVMFAPDHRRAAGELVRVCRPGGTIGLASWTPEGFFGRMLAAIRPYRPSLSQAVHPAPLWGREGYIAGLLGDGVRNVTARRGMLPVSRFRSAAAVHAYFKTYYGPTIEAYANIGHNRLVAAELDAQLIELADQHLADGRMQWEYLQVTAVKA